MESAEQTAVKIQATAVEVDDQLEAARVTDAIEAKYGAASNGGLEPPETSAAKICEKHLLQT